MLLILESDSAFGEIVIVASTAWQLELILLFGLVTTSSKNNFKLFEWVVIICFLLCYSRLIAEDFLYVFMC